MTYITSQRRVGERGFTLIELLLAMTFFTFILQFIVIGFIQVTRTYQKAVTLKTIQDVNRQLVDDILRRGSLASVLRIDNDNLCIDNIRYRRAQPPGVTDPDNQTIVREDVVISGNTACSAATVTGSEYLLPHAATGPGGLTVDKFQVLPVDDGNPATPITSAYIDVSFSAALSDSLCIADQPGSQYCGITSIQTAVTLRGD